MLRHHFPHFFWLLLSTLCVFTASGQKKTISFQIIETTDVHGNYFPYDFINRADGEGSLSRICGYVEDLRMRKGSEHVLLLDNGDILQGQPAAYYYNYIDTTDTHVCASILNFMRYDAACVGNHDVETGHAVYDRWAAQLEMPLLGANVINTETGSPYWKPYTIIKKDGIRFAVLGLLTPTIPNWLPKELWTGMDFDDMVSTAKMYMPEMQKQADVVIGLFHSGVGDADALGERIENASLQVARQVPGFDLILCGHDHRQALRKVANIKGDSVVVLNAGPNATHIAKATLTITKKGKHITSKAINAEIVDICGRQPDLTFLETFRREQNKITAFINAKIGTNDMVLSAKDAFFGPSPFVDFIHKMQLDISQADISFSAPLSLEAKIDSGDIHVSDMFNLYKYENKLCVMRLSGQEIKDYLEYSYAGWTNQMTSPRDHMLRFSKENIHAEDHWQRLETPSYNFDSAFGLLYDVDLTKPKGEKISITSLADGRPFSSDSTYSVAINSYRAGGGGDLLTDGAGIAHDSLEARIIWRSEYDLRYYLMQEIKKAGGIQVPSEKHWKFIPEAWVKETAPRDYKVLFE